MVKFAFPSRGVLLPVRRDETRRELERGLSYSRLAKNVVGSRILAPGGKKQHVFLQ